MRLLLAFALAACAVACGGSSESDRASGPVSFVSEPSAEDRAVYLRARTEGDQLMLDVIAQGVPDLHGAAFRVTWDPGALRFASAHAGPSWSKQALLLAKEGTPGQLAVAWTEKGESAGHDATAPLVLGTLVFEAKSRKGTAVSFRADRSTLVDHHGKPATVSWRAGAVLAR
jgi:hypothetical protein